MGCFGRALWILYAPGFLLSQNFGADYVMYYSLRNFTLDNSRICTYNKKADCNDACVAQLVEQLTRNEQVADAI